MKLPPPSFRCCFFCEKKFGEVLHGKNPNEFAYFFFAGRSWSDYMTRNPQQRTMKSGKFPGLVYRKLFIIPGIYIYMGVSLNGDIPQTPPNDHFSRQTPWLLGKPTSLGNLHIIDSFPKKNGHLIFHSKFGSSSLEDHPS